MKSMKRVAGILLAILILAASIAPAMATETGRYTPVGISASMDSLGLTETLTVRKANERNPAVTYTLTLNSAMKVYSATNTSGLTTTYGRTAGVTGALTTGTKVADVSFAAGEVVGGTSSPKTKPYVDDASFITALKAMRFSEPGIYYWDIKKDATTNVGNLTNHNYSEADDDGTVLMVRVDDNGGALTAIAEIVALDSNGLLTNDKPNDYKDYYPAETGTLTLKKQVKGNQAAKDQYFKFDVTISGMEDFKGSTLTLDVTGGNSVVSNDRTNKYADENFAAGTTNEQTITIANDGTARATFWLKHNEVIKISNIFPGATYTIVESQNTGYTVGITNNGDEASTNEATTTAKMPTGQAASVIYENTKETATPTGINVQAAAPLFGVLLAGALLALLLLGKRKNDEA